MSLCFLLGCEANNKYTYIQIVYKEVKPGDSVRKFIAGKIILETSDSVAYLNAFVKFCISLKAYEHRVNSSAGKLSFQPIGFMLINENGVDISKSITFTTKDYMERKIEKEIREMTFP